MRKRQYFNPSFIGMMLVLLLSISCHSSTKKIVVPTADLQQYQFAHLDSLLAQEERAVLVFLHTNWCKYCKNMEQTTFQDPEVIALLNEQYYFIPFNAEQQESVQFNDHLFQYQASGSGSGTHELAIALGSMENGLIYPTTIVLNSDYEINFRYNSFLSANDFLKVLGAGH